MDFTASHAQDAYRRGQVSASGPVRIIVLLYDGAIRFAKQARGNHDDPSTRGNALGRAHAIVSELLVSLNHEQGGEIAGNLEELYRYVLDAFICANVDGDLRRLDSAIEVLETLATSWRELEASEAKAK